MTRSGHLNFFDKFGFIGEFPTNTITERVILSGAQRSRTRSAMRSIGISFGISVSLFFF